MTNHPSDAHLAELTLELCRVPSETGHEEALADLVEAFCREAAGDEGVTRIGNSVICAPASDERSEVPCVALVGHLDTVRCAERQRYEVTAERVYGCGASDMKGGVAVMMALLPLWETFRAARPVWIFYDREEGPFEENGLEPVLASGVLPELDLALVLEPTDGALQLGCMGSLHAMVHVRGQRAHSARPWQGENALYRAIPLLQRLAEFGRHEVRFGELTFYEVMVATQAETHNSQNVVPDLLELNVNFRFAPGKTPEQAEREVRDLVGTDGEMEVRDVAPAGQVYLEHPLLDPWRERLGIPLQPKQAWTDVARFTERGIPAVNYGPGETAQAHQADEWCSVASLERAYATLIDFFEAGPASTSGD